MWAVLSLVLGVNVIGDYFSLWETRYILEKIRNSSSTLTMGTYWICDIAISVVIFSLCLPVFIILVEMARIIENWSHIYTINWIDVANVPLVMVNEDMYF